MKDNKIIAEFLIGEWNLESLNMQHDTSYDLFGVMELGDVFADISGDNPNAKHFFSPDEMQFHTSWDWLMPVVEKIESTSIDNKDNSDRFFNVMIEVFECNINGGEISICKSANTKRKAIYQAVVEFIKFYNNKNK